MNSLLTDAEIDRLLEETQALEVAEWGSATLHAALLELQAHRRDARARGAIPMFVSGQPSEGEMVDALTILTGGSHIPDAYNRAHGLFRGLIFEVLHLRRQVTRVQMQATNEQELRRVADRERMDAIAERDAILIATRELSRTREKVRPSKVEAATVNRTPVEIPDDKQTPEYKAAAARIAAAVDANRDADQADIDFVMREQLKSAGFDDPEMLDEMVPPPKKTS